jgi:hypothetical protein
MGKAQYLTRMELFLRARLVRCAWEEAIISCPEMHNLALTAEVMGDCHWARKNGRYALTAMV